MSKAYFIEGIPGSGKTTYAQRLFEHLKSQGKSVELFSEGDLHPIDLAWCSIVKKDRFNELCEKHSAYRDQILSQSNFLGNKVITAYTKIKVKDEDVDLYDDFSPHEIYRVNDFNHFKDTHIKLWETFNQDHKNDTIYVFECIFLQNHINELILKFGLKKKEILKYFQTLVDTLDSIEMEVIYLKPLDIKQTFDHVIEERKSNNEKYKDWIDQVIEYFENTKFGKEKGYIGYQGALQYFIDRQKIECDILKELRVKKAIFELRQNYDAVFETIKDYIE